MALLATAAIALLPDADLPVRSRRRALGGLLGHPWLGWLIVAGLILVIGAILGRLGYVMLKRA